MFENFYKGRHLHKTEMALNKYMHPRNIYKHRKPNFQELALKYPNFRKYLFADLTGKYFLDFKHTESLRQLTLTLLKEDYDLDLELPLDRLIPTIPLRLNYIHWIEDILTGSKAGQDVKGIDIGTGSSCIYPLLSCRLNPTWKFCASEIDDQNYMFATKNVSKNGYKDKINVKQVADDTTLHGVISDNEDTYDFCMCNPPFFADHLEAQAVTKSRNYSHSNPKSVCTADAKESIVEGGEAQFVKKIIHDSLLLKSRVRVYTSMVGKKTSLPAIKEELRKTQVAKFSTTEFCQGKTMRWGVAWTFDSEVVFPKSLFQECKKEKPPLVYSVPWNPAVNTKHNVPGVAERVKHLLDELQIEYMVTKKEGSVISMSATAKENTWSHQRRKRREKLQKHGNSDSVSTKRMEKKNVVRYTNIAVDGSTQNTCEAREVTSDNPGKETTEEHNTGTEMESSPQQNTGTEKESSQQQNTGTEKKSTQEHNTRTETESSPQQNTGTEKESSPQQNTGTEKESSPQQNTGTEKESSPQQNTGTEKESTMEQNTGAQQDSPLEQKTETEKESTPKQHTGTETIFVPKENKTEHKDVEMCQDNNENAFRPEKDENDRKRKVSGETDVTSVNKKQKSSSEEELLNSEICMHDKHSNDQVLGGKQVSLETSPTSKDEITTDTRPDEICDVFQDDTEEKFLLKFTVKVKKIPRDLILEMAFVDGDNRELLHQVMQYFKNKLKQK